MTKGDVIERYTRKALKFYGQNGDNILISDTIEYITQFSMIHGYTWCCMSFFIN